MTTHRSHILAAVTALAVLAPAAAAQADDLAVPAPGAQAVTAGGGYVVWSQPEGARFRLAVRAPDGTVSLPAIPSFPQPPAVQIGGDGGELTKQQIVALYARCSGGDCDVRRLDLAAGTESGVPGLGRPDVSETAAAVSQGRYVVARRGGGKTGLWTIRVAKDRRISTRRLTTTVPREVSWNGGRIWSLERAGEETTRIVSRRSSGKGSALVRKVPSTAFGLSATRYRATFSVLSGQSVIPYATSRVGGSGTPATSVALIAGDRALPTGSTSAAQGASSGETGWATTPDGVVRLTPRVRFVAR